MKQTPATNFHVETGKLKKKRLTKIKSTENNYKRIFNSGHKKYSICTAARIEALGLDGLDC